jgi:holo-ACP synthase
MTYALRALDILMANRRWPVLGRELCLDPTGPEALLVVDAGSRDLKEAATRLEDENPLGRLWDLDVIDPVEGAISRRTLGLPPRRCLLCREDAHVCVRSRAHPLHKLQNAVRKIFHAYREP